MSDAPTDAIFYGFKVKADPNVPEGEIQMRDPDTGEVLAAMTDTTDDAVTLETAMIRFGIRNDLNCTGEPRMTTERQHTLTMTDAELAEIRARAEAASPGPWEAEYFAHEIGADWYNIEGPAVFTIPYIAKADATFIAHARTDVEALLDELAAAREIIEWVYAWSQAYPLDVFPEPDKKRAHELLQAGGMSLDAVSASAIRHAVKSIGQDAANYLHSATEDADDRTT